MDTILAYTESNRSTRNMIPNGKADNTRRQTKTSPNAGALSSSQGLGRTDFFSENFSETSIPDLYWDDLADVPVSEDPMALFNWHQWGDTVDEPISAPSPSFELLGSTKGHEGTKGHEDTRCEGLDTDPHLHDDTHYYCSANNLSGGCIVSASAAITEKTPYFDHVRSSLYCWVLESMKKSHENENTRIIEALQGLLAANSLTTNNCSSKELDIISVLTDLRSERSFGKELFHKRIEACFAELDSNIGIFLDLATVDALVDQVLFYPLVSNPTCIALFFSVLAIGSRRLDLSHGTGTIKGATIGFFRIALRMRPHPYDETSLLTLQTYFSYTIGANSTSSLMADATSGLQTLRLHSCSAIDKLSSDCLEQARIKRVFWAIYSMEKPYCLQEGLLPLIHSEYADHNISASQGSPCKGDWLNVNIRYAEICSAILQQLHTQRQSRKNYSCCFRGVDCEHNSASAVSRLEATLTTWKNDFFFDFRLDNLSALPCDERRHRLTYISKYHFAVVAIHSLPETENTDMSKERRCKSAREILNMSAHISWADLCDNWSLCSVTSLATCILVAGTIEKASVVKAQRNIAATTGIRSNEHSYKSGIETDISYIVQAGVTRGLVLILRLGNNQFDRPIDSRTPIND
ncbi:hypothetical protein COCCADRAFT_41782 [Bipolaris zeicola 26-R-13]|uniref:Uncharacterized protein n=1 Tax=Cochliobolus carbonum (strain 26-R-13) TaxID=930089 RepID=W6XXP1_COCC2|nr:uncharacterized protein COCCADRAFT_41782 [Bipolaris zeicola 26-R-13]EUC27509.1 hypothetical protein COCCADRAFT_41782 [Bipolaris zeicola 26-R-13]